MRAPDELIGHLRRENYHPRSDKHSNFICNQITGDLLENCPVLAERADRGEIVVKQRHKQTIGYDEWVIDLAFGEPSSAPVSPREEARIVISEPSVIQIAIEAKSVMTEHKKARKNRLRDMHAFHSHAHNYSPNTIAAGILMINASRYFWSPLRRNDDITDHGDVSRLTSEIVGTYRSIPLRNSASAPPGMEAVGIIVVEHDNLAKNPNLPPDAPKPHLSSLASPPLGLSPGDPLHYPTMIRRICNAYKERFV